MPRLIFIDAIVLTIAGEFLDTLLFATETAEVLQKPVYLTGISAKKKKRRTDE